MSKLTSADAEYLNIIEDIIKYGDSHEDRTGVGTKRVFGAMYRFNLEEEFPMITCKRAAFKNTIAELLWFLSGSTNVNDLAAIYKPVEKWWRPFADKRGTDGDLGPMYGRQLRDYNGQGVDQVLRVINKIKDNKNSRRILMTSYNPIEADLGALYPCHGLATQFMIDSSDRLHMSTLQRSADVGLGLPHNWLSYAMLQHMIAKVCGLQVGDLVYQVNDLHIYTDHITPLVNMEAMSYSNPTIDLTTHSHIDNYKMNDFNLYNYKSGPKVNLSMAV